MFEYHNLPYMEEEAKAAIWAALCELAMLIWRETWLVEREGVNDVETSRELGSIESRQKEVEAVLWEYSSQHWLSRGEYLEWWHETVGTTSSRSCYYCFES